MNKMNKIIIIITIFLFYFSNCASYTSYELAYAAYEMFDPYIVYGLFDKDGLLSANYFSNIKDLLYEIHDDEYRLTYLFMVEEFDFSFTSQNDYMADFLNRVIPSSIQIQNYLIFIYSVNDDIFLSYVGNTIIKKEDVNQFYSENKEKYNDNYEEVLFHFLEDINDKIKKTSKTYAIVLVCVFAVIIIVGFSIYCCYKKKKCCWKKKEKNENQNQVQINYNQNQQQMNYMNNNRNNRNNLQNNNLNSNNNLQNNYNQINNNNVNVNDYYNYQSGGIVGQNVYNNNVNNPQQNVVYYSQQGYSSHNN